MYVVHLDTGQFYQSNGTVIRAWANPWPNPVTIHRTMLWGGISIGACMDFDVELYLQGAAYNMQSVGDDQQWIGAMPLDILAFDRYGASNGGNYQSDKVWDLGVAVTLTPGSQLVLSANCVQHGVGTNPVMNTPYANDNCQAQAYVWMT